MKIAIPLFWIITVTLAFVVGQQFSTNHSAVSESTPNRNEQNLALTHMPDSEQTVPLFPTPTEPQLDNVPASSVDEVISQIKTLLGDNFSMHFGNIAKAYSYIQSLNDEQIVEALDLLRANADDAKYSQTMLMFLSRYAETSPQAAISYIQDNIRSNGIKTQAQMAVLGVWAQTQPLEALEWVKSARNSNTMRGFDANLLPIFSNLAKQDLQLAFNELTTLSETNGLQMAVLGIAQSLSNGSQFAELIDQAEEFDNKKITRAVLSAWTTKNPQDTLDWFYQLDESPRKQELEQAIFDSYIFTKPEEAADWFLAQAPVQQIQTRTDQIVERWGAQNPQAALEWVNKQVSIDSQQTVKKLFNRAVYSHPDFVQENLELLSSTKQKSDILFRVYLTIQRESQKRADDFLSSSAYKNEINDKLAKMQKRKNGNL